MVEWRWERQSAWPHNARAEGRMKELVMSHLRLDPETRSMETHTDLRFCATRMPLKEESDVEKWNKEGERSTGFNAVLGISLWPIFVPAYNSNTEVS